MNNIHEKTTTVINYLLVLYTFLLPFNIHMSTTILHLIMLLYLFSGNLKDKVLFALKHKVVQAVISFFLLYLLWSINSNQMDIIFWKLNTFKYLFYIIIFITILQISFKNKIKNAFLISIFISEIISLLMLANYTMPFLITGYGKYVPFFYTYSQYSLLIIIAVGLSLFEFIKAKSNLQKVLALILFSLSTFTIFILDSKAAYILYFIILFIVVYQSFQINKKIIFIFLSSVIAIYVLAFSYSSTFHTRMTNIYKELNDITKNGTYNGSTGERIGMDIIGFKLFLAKPFLGYGTQEHINLAIETIEDLNVSQGQKNNLLVFKNLRFPAMQTLHNEYLDHILQFGIIGLFILLNMFYSLYKMRIQDSQWKNLNTILLVTFMLYMLENYFFVLNQLGEIFVILISLTITTYYNSVQRNIEE